MRLREEVGRTARAVLGLVLPSHCPSCSEPAHWQREPWCVRCAPLPQPAIVRPRPCPVGFPLTWSAGYYRDELRDGVLAYKDGARRDLARDLVQLLATTCEHAGWQRSLTLVPIPSSRRAVRARGFDHTSELAARLARRMPRTDWLRLLARPAPEDDGERTAQQRAQRRAVVTPSGRRAVLTRRPVLLVDDVATTGWTLTSAASALEHAGYEVAGAVVLAATVLRARGSGE